MKPKLFIGSSSEAINVAGDFAKLLADDATCVIWKHAPEFEPTTSTLSSLLHACQAYDLGLFLLTPDDDITCRGKKGKSARDNVLLELGMFLGALGPDRTFAVVQADDEGTPCVKITSDISGISIPRFALNADTATRIASVTEAVHGIKLKINNVGLRPINFRDYSWGFSVSRYCLHLTIPKSEIVRVSPQLVGKLFIIAGRKYNDEVDFSEDKSVAKSRLRIISPHLTTKLRIEVKSKVIFKDTKIGDDIELCLIMVPEDFALEDMKKLTLLDLQNADCIRLVYMRCNAEP